MIVGLVGKKGSGKSTAASIAKSEYGYHILSFAAPLKKMVSEAFNIPMFLFTDPVLKETALLEEIKPNEDFISKLVDHAYYNLIPVSSQQKTAMMLQLSNMPSLMTPRKLLQFVGTDLFRNCVSESYWLHVMQMQIDEVGRRSSNIIIDDVRFPDEANFVKERSGYLIKLNRPGQPNTDNHASEALIDSIEADFVIRNDDLLFFKEALRFSLTELYQEFRESK